MKRRPLYVVTCCDHCSNAAEWLLRNGKKACDEHKTLIGLHEDATTRFQPLLEWAPSLSTWPS